MRLLDSSGLKRAGFSSKTTVLNGPNGQDGTPKSLEITTFERKVDHRSGFSGVDIHPNTLAPKWPGPNSQRVRLQGVADERQVSPVQGLEDRAIVALPRPGAFKKGALQSGGLDSGKGNGSPERQWSGRVESRCLRDVARTAPLS